MPSYGGDLVFPDKSLHEVIWENLLEYGDDIAIIDGSSDGKSLTYMELYHYSRKCTSYLQAIGIEKGDFVSICASGSLEFTYLMIGILGSGAIVTPCNPSYRKAEILHEFNISRPRVVFVDEELVEKMKSVKADVSCIEKLIVIGNSSEFVTLGEILSGPNVEKLRVVEIDPRNDAALAPRSSGTTGLPKCLLVTHRNFVAYNATDQRDSGILETSDTFYSMYSDRPMYHASGFLFMIRNLVHGHRTVTAKKFRLDEMFRIIEKYQVTSAQCAPPVLIEMANTKISNQYNLSSLKLILTAGAAIAPDVAQRVMKKYKASITTMYAMNEALGVSSYVIPEGDLSNSSGKPIQGMEVKITDLSTEEECPAGCDGEIRLRSPQGDVSTNILLDSVHRRNMPEQFVIPRFHFDREFRHKEVFKEYYKNDIANSTAFDRDGWFRTGDIGHLDDDGKVYITDRLKEIIQYRMIQVSPAELESVILSHPKVADVGVIGIPDELDGEHPKAFVVPRDESLTAEEVHQIVDDNLVEYKHLRGGVEFVSAIPKSATGKIQRNVLKKMAGF